MLYAAWQHIVRTRPNDFALAELESGRRWTFAELAHAAQALPSSNRLIFPSGNDVMFILDVLRAWRGGGIVCPLDHGQKPPEIDSAPHDCVHFKTTSGTANAPRLVAFTAQQLLADVNNIIATMGLRPEWPNVGAISLAHSYGFSNLVLPLLTSGIPLVLTASRLPETIRQAATQFESLTLPGVPALWRVWRDAGVISPSIKLAISAGAALPVTLEREIFERDGLKVHNFYGASECGGICYDVSTTPRTSNEDVGSPLDGVQLATDAEGRLLVTSQAVGQTYWPSPDAALSDGVFRVGDRVALRDGRVFLQGRHTDVINIAGQKVAPETIEQAILGFPGVRECVVFGAAEHGNVRHEVIVACVAGTKDLDVAQLKRLASEHLPAWQAPRHWQIVPTLSDPNRGKISRAQWRERFLAENSGS
jgi:acyl-coenzyme A synthetase/AMP-(fatty) acid ligase